MKHEPPSSHASCMVCGEHSILGIKFIREGNTAVATFQANTQWQGYAGVLHGGMICTLLDAAMTHCLFHMGIEAMTAEIKVRFIKPVPCKEILTIRAVLQNQRHHLYKLQANLSCAGEVLALGEACFMKGKTVQAAL